MTPPILKVPDEGKHCVVVASVSGDETGTIAPPPPAKRYFTAEWDCVTFSLVTDDPKNVFGMIKQWYVDAGNSETAFLERCMEIGDPCFIELTEAEAATKMGFDDARDGGSYPLTTFELGALLSSEY